MKVYYKMSTEPLIRRTVEVQVKCNGYWTESPKISYEEQKLWDASVKQYEIGYEVYRFE